MALMTLRQVEQRLRELHAQHGTVSAAFAAADEEERRLLRDYLTSADDILRRFDPQPADFELLRQSPPAGARVDEERLGDGTRGVLDRLTPYQRRLRTLSMEELLAGEGGEGALWALYVQNLRRLAISLNQDACIVITGYEGSGKSTLALKLAQWLEPGFTAEHVCFDAEQLLGLVQKAPRGSVVLHDEAVNGLYAREAMGIDNRVLTAAAMVARARNLFWVLCIPHLHNLDPYFREHRVRSWWHVVQRGEALGHIAKRSPYYPETFWDPFLRYQYGAVRGPIWDAYDKSKQHYILDKLGQDAERADKVKRKKRGEA